MSQTRATVEIPASADDVWKLLGGFNALPDWLPFITESVASEGGRLRHLTTADGALVIERLQSFDNAARTYSYSIEQGPFPVTNYLATVKVSEVPGKQAALVEWGGQFVAAGVTEAEAIAIFDGVYQGGLKELSKHFPG
jgi:hypothetical protein